MKTLTILILLTLSSSPLLSQVTFQKTIGTSDNQDGWFRAYCVQSTNDGGLIVSGHGYDPSGGIALMKLTNAGSLTWSKIIHGGVYGEYVQQTGDGGYIIATEESLKLIKTDNAGSVQWGKLYFVGNNLGSGVYVQQNTDGGFLLVGQIFQTTQTDKNIGVIKTDAGGNVIWARGFGSATDDIVNTAIQTSDGGFIIGGSTPTLTKFDSVGNLLWSKSFTGVGVSDIEQTVDGNYILASGGAATLIKMDDVGNILWAKKHSTSGASTVKETPDGGYILLCDGFLLKTDNQGSGSWAKSYTLGASLNSMTTTSDDGYCVVGMISLAQFGGQGYDAFVMKTDAFGNAGCHDSIVSYATSDVMVSSTNVTYTAMTQSATNTLSISDGSNGTTFTICTTENISEPINSNNNITLSPNPADKQTVLKWNYTIKTGNLTIYNTLGQQVFRSDIKSQDHIKLSLDNFISGQYFYRLTDIINNSSHTGKIIVEK